MTIYELLGYESPDELEKLSDEQLNTFFAPYLNVTRPELAAKETTTKPMHSSSTGRSLKHQEQLELEARKQLVMKLAAEKGIKLNL
jgi:hypothetical protein